MIVLRYAPNAKLLRPGAFNIVADHGGLWRIEALIKSTEASRLWHISIWAQIQRRCESRRKDPEGHPVLWLSRSSEDVFFVEQARHAPDMALEVLLLNGWRPPSA